LTYGAIPPGIADSISEKFGAIRDAPTVSGGMVNSAARVETNAGPVFVKWKQNAPPRLFSCEAEGLRALSGASMLRIPEVLLVSDDDAASRPPFLVLEWLECRPPRNPASFAERLAQGVAALHAGNRASDGRYGLDYDNYLGSLEQRNTKSGSWPEFYRDRRLGEMLRLGRQNGWLSTPRQRALAKLMERSCDLLAHPGDDPVLIHGDLWAGNFLALGDDPALIDPAVHYADREVELAFIELFGGFPQRFGEIYRAAFPLDSGYPDRRPLLQLYPLLVHLRHFGEEYGPSVDRVLARYGA
jgi:fructosamine-3-kinase